MKKHFNLRKQAGMTLMEILASLAIIASVIVGALSLFGSATSSNNSTALLKDITAVRTATQQLFLGQGGYGAAAALNTTLITANKIPGDMTTATPVINTATGGTLTVTGNTTNFTMTLTNVPADICTALLTNASSGWSAVQVGASAAVTTFPVSPTIATAAAQCGGTAPFSVKWTTLN